MKRLSLYSSRQVWENINGKRKDYSVSCVATEKAKLSWYSNPMQQHLHKFCDLPFAKNRDVWPALYTCPFEILQRPSEHPLIYSEMHLPLCWCQILGGQESLLTLSWTAQVTFQVFLRASWGLFAFLHLTSAKVHYQQASFLPLQQIPQLNFVPLGFQR